MRIQRSSLILVITFVVVTGLMIAVTGAIFARWRWQDSTGYRAMFTDASGLDTGVDVRASGVSVGTVDEIELTDDDQVLVSFTVPEYLPMTISTQARIRYANLTGDRYLELTPGEDPSAAALHEGQTIGIERTQPALDLDTLFAGFDPLMQALDGDEVNQLTSNILDVSQGQAGAIEHMLAQVASFTTRLAERDQLIGDVITNLTKALATVDDRRNELSQLITGLDELLAGLAQDRKELGRSLEGIDTLAADAADLLRKVRPDFKANIDQLGVTSRSLNENVVRIEEVLDLYPTTIQRLGRGGAYGSFFNFFLCSVQIQLSVAGQNPITMPRSSSETERCVDPSVKEAP